MPQPLLPRVAVLGLLLAAALSSANVLADRHDRHDGPWTFDERFHHNHYYPARGYVTPVLPPGNVAIGYGSGRFFFHSGVWYRPSGGYYTVVTPPLGIAVPVLPPNVVTVWVGSVPNYYANGVYYMEASSGGYMVVAPPAEQMISTAPPSLSSGISSVPSDSPSPVPSRSASPVPSSSPSPVPPGTVSPIPPAAPGEQLFVYPRNNQKPSQSDADRAECRRWGTEQVGFNPVLASPDDPRHSDYRRAVTACLEGRGYTVR
ncbi:MAG: hypothetical protein KGZ83_05270 [Sulfuricella sp.]|nr:hypothetical protein [Sulfuricella sp.]